MNTENLKKIPEQIAKTAVRRSGLVLPVASILMAGCFGHVQGRDPGQTPATATPAAASGEPGQKTLNINIQGQLTLADATPTPRSEMSTPIPSTPQSQEVGTTDIAIRYNPNTKDCDLIDPRTGAIVNLPNPQRDWYPTGKGVKDDLKEVTLKRGQVAVVEGFKVDGWRGVYEAIRATDGYVTVIKTITDGAISVYNNEYDATVGFCELVKTAHDNGYANDNVRVPEWMRVVRSIDSSNSYAPSTPATLGSQETSDLSFGIVFDPIKKDCEIVDRKTGIIVDPKNPRGTSSEAKNEVRFITTHLYPGQIAVFAADQINGQGNGVFRVLEADYGKQITSSDWIKNGRVSVYGNRTDAIIGFCREIQDAAAPYNNKLRNDISIPKWMEVK